MSLEDFERWIYDSEELQNLMTEDVVLEAYTLNYKQRDAKYQCKHPAKWGVKHYAVIDLRCC